MGRKKYFCDYCNRYFNDDHNTRLKHLNSVGHLNAKKEHYKMFRDPETVLQEESVKKPCRKFHFEGYCPFGGSCTYSHYTREDLETIKQDLIRVKSKQAVQPTVDGWLMKYHQGLEIKKQKSEEVLWSCLLPHEILAGAPMLPPSMLPFHIKQFNTANLAIWGE